MKIKFLFSFCLLFTLGVSSQQNLGSFVDNSNVWMNYGGYWSFDSYSRNHHFYFFQGDTTIGNYTYKKMYRDLKDTSFYNDGFTPPTVYSYPLFYEGAFRQVDKSVFMVYPNSTNEVLYIDFDLNIGDTVMYFPFGSTNQTVTSIDSIAFGNQYRKRFNTTRGIIYEGIGHQWGLFKDGSQMGIEGGIYLSCFHQFGETQEVYAFGTSAPCYEYNNSVVGNNELSIELSDVSIYPNPVSTKLTFSNINSYFTYNISDLQGKTLKQGANEKQIEIEQLPTGTYVIGISTDNEVKQLRFVKL